MEAEKHIAIKDLHRRAMNSAASALAQRSSGVSCELVSSSYREAALLEEEAYTLAGEVKYNDQDPANTLPRFLLGTSTAALYISAGDYDYASVIVETLQTDITLNRMVVYPLLLENLDKVVGQIDERRWGRV